MSLRIQVGLPPAYTVTVTRVTRMILSDMPLAATVIPLGWRRQQQRQPQPVPELGVSP